MCKSAKAATRETPVARARPRCEQRRRRPRATCSPRLDHPYPAARHLTSSAAGVEHLLVTHVEALAGSKFVAGNDYASYNLARLLLRLLTPPLLLLDLVHGGEEPFSVAGKAWLE